MNFLKNEKVHDVALLGGLFAIGGLVIFVLRSKPVANVIASLKNKVGGN